MSRIISCDLGGSGARSSVRLIEKDGALYVEKRFFGGAGCPYLLNEITARRVLSHPAVAPIIWRLGDGFVMPYYAQRDAWRDTGRNLYPAPRAKRIMAFMQWLAAEGYAMIDWHPGAFLFDERDDLKVIDFEYLAPIRPAKNFCESPDYTGANIHTNFAVPIRKKGYKYMWLPVAGASYACLTQASPARLAAVRALYLLARRWPKYAYKKAERAMKRKKAT